MRQISIYLTSLNILLSGWVIYFKPGTIVLFLLLLVNSLLVIYYNSRSIKIKIVKYIPTIFLLLYFWFPKQMNYNEYSWLLLIYFVYLVIILSSSQEYQSRVYSKIVQILSLVLIPGLIIFVINVLFKFNYFKPIVDHYIPSQTTGRVYLIYPFYAKEITAMMSSFRFNSVFDEPGYLGTLLFFLLLINKFDVKKWYNIIFVISGLFTFSIAFYLLTGSYLLISLDRKQRYNAIVLYIVSVLIIFVIFNEYFTKLIIPRLYFNSETMTIVGDNRGGIILQLRCLADLIENNFIVVLFGSGISVTHYIGSTYNLLQDSVWVRLIYQAGVIPLMIFIFYIYYYMKRNGNNYIFLSYYLLSIYQRPQIFQLLMLFILFYGISNKSEFILQKNELL